MRAGPETKTRAEPVDPTAFHITVQLIRNGTFGHADAEEVARRLDDEGHDDAAHAVRAALIEAFGEQPADERRAGMVLVPRLRLGSDGGNRD